MIGLKNRPAWSVVPDHNNARSRGTARVTASLSRPVSSSGLMTSCCHPVPTGLVLLFEVGARPPHDGMRRMGRYNLRDGLAANQQQDRRSLRTHPTRRPREDIFLPKQNALSKVDPERATAGAMP